MIERNRGLAEPQRHWGEVERLIAEAAAAAPGASEPELLCARMLVEQGQRARAIDVLETAAARLPTSVVLWIEQVEVRAWQKEFKAARELLDRAEQGVRRPGRPPAGARTARDRRGRAPGRPDPQRAGRGIEPFSREDRRRLLTELATDLAPRGTWRGPSGPGPGWPRRSPRASSRASSSSTWRSDPATPRQAEAQVRAIEKLDEQFAQFCRAQYLAWQARGAGDAATKAKLRVTARGLLTELKARRPDWYRVPLALASLDEQELEETGPDEARKREMLESSITSYRRAIELGYRDTAVVRHFVQLLFRAGRGGEALEFYSQIPGIGQLTGDLGRMAVADGRGQSRLPPGRGAGTQGGRGQPRGFPGPGVAGRVLMEDRRPDEAKAVLRAAVDAAKADPDRWSTLVRFEVQNRHPERAERVVQEAEAHIGKTPLALAQCCRIIGKAYEADEPDRARSWYDRARGWFAKAQEALKDPEDPTVRRRLAEFLLQTNQAAEAEAPLKEILRGPPPASRPTSPPGPGAAWRRSTPPRARRGPPRPWRCSTTRREGASPTPTTCESSRWCTRPRGRPRDAGRPSATSSR